jgi:hypothetical protein
VTMTDPAPAGTLTAPADDLTLDVAQTLADRIDGVVEIDLDSFTIGEMDQLGALTMQGHGRLSVFVWLTLRRQGIECSLDEVAALPARKMRQVRGEDTATVPLR